MILKKNLIFKHISNFKYTISKFSIIINLILFILFLSLLFNFIINYKSLFIDLHNEIYLSILLLIINIIKIILICLVFYFFFFFSIDRFSENFFIFLKRFNIEQIINQYLPFIGSFKRLNSLRNIGVNYSFAIKVYFSILLISFFCRFFFFIIINNHHNFFYLFILPIIFFASYFLIIFFFFNFKNYIKNSILIILLILFTISLDILNTYFISKFLNFNFNLYELILLSNVQFIVDFLKIFGSNLFISEFFMGKYFQFYNDLNFNDGVAYRILVRFFDFVSLFTLIIFNFLISIYFSNFYIKDN